MLTSLSGGANQAGYGLVGFRFNRPATLSQLSQAQTQYDLTQGACGGGSPRWEIDLQDPAHPSDTVSFSVFFGTQPYGGCTTGAQQEPNIAGPSSAQQWFYGNSSTACGTYAQVVNGTETGACTPAAYGAWRVKDIEVIVDGGWSQSGQLNPGVQQVLLQKLRIGVAQAKFVFFPLPSGR